jgi:hypothetical protein
MMVTFFKVNNQCLKVFLDPSYNTNLEIDKIDLIAFDNFFSKLMKNLKLFTRTYSFIYLKYKNLLYLLKQVIMVK